VALVGIDGSEDGIAIIREKRIRELVTMLVVPSNCSTLRRNMDGGNMFLRSDGSNKSHTASHPRRENSSISR
jgi:hypothetical protein